MLRSLSIRNFALIDSLEVDFTSGFSVITGETGTGKSVLLGAISVMLGQRSDAKAVREGAERCIIEGHFDLSALSLSDFFESNDLFYDESDCIVRREVAANGRSRAFVNDTPVSVALLKDLGCRLIDIHSQHQNLLLGDKNFQLDVLDSLSADARELSEYRKLFSEYSKATDELEKLKAALGKSKDDADWLRYQLEEIDREAFREGEQEELEQEQQELAHAEEIQSALYGALNLIAGDEEQNVVRRLRDAVSSLSRIAEHYPAADALSERIDASSIELKDCCDELRERAERVTFSPDRLEWVDTRLARIYDMMRKHRVSSLFDLLQLADDYRNRLQQIDGGDEEIRILEKRCSALLKEMTAAADAITVKRKEAAVKLQKEITDILVTLGMPLIRFEVDFAGSRNFTSSGADAVTFLFSANSTSPMQPLSDVASGGEMARVMLALKSLIADYKQQPTLIFDEIDTGISGVLAERMGRLMKKMGKANRQVVSITHLPQVAALGESHYKVYKEETAHGTRTNIIPLEGEERVREIAQMMSGETLTGAALENARLLLSEK